MLQVCKGLGCLELLWPHAFISHTKKSLGFAIHSRPSSLRPSRPSFGTASTRPIFSFTESFHLVTSQTLFSAWCTSSFLIFTCERLPTMGGQNFNYSSRPLASLPILLVDAHSSSSHYSSTLAHPFLALVHQCFPHLMHYITTV